MDYNGEIVFVVTDSNSINVNFGLDFLPTKIVNKGDIVALGRKATQNKWLYIAQFSSGDEYLQKLDEVTDLLYNKSEYITKLLTEYKEVSINIYIRSDFAEIGYSLPVHIIKKIASLGCSVNFETLSFGMAVNEDT